jgi:predicted ribosomally synthesized peptide with SipW-like signal peptide
MSNKKRILITSFSVIILCLCILVGVSYSLFTDSEQVTNHLKSGDLDITLERVSLEYATLNSQGYLEIEEDYEIVDFTNDKNENIFGLDQEKLIAPGSYYEATLKLSNKSTVAFDYTIEIVLNSVANEFAEQLKVYLDGDTEGKLLSEINYGNKYILKGTAPVEVNKSTEFTVKVAFIHDKNNNAAQDSSISFDLVVSATQTTTIKK